MDIGKLGIHILVYTPQIEYQMKINISVCLSVFSYNIYLWVDLTWMKIFKIMSLHNFQAEYEIRINIPVCFCFLLHAVMCWRSVWSRKLLHNELRSWIKLHTFFEALKKVDRKGPYLMKLWSKNSPHVLLNIRNENPLYKPFEKSLHVLIIKMRLYEEVSCIVFVQIPNT